MDPDVPTGKGLTLEENRRLRALLKQLIDERYKNQTALAEALRIKQSTVSSFMSRERQGSSFQVAKRACILAGVPLSTIIEGLEAAPPMPGGELLVMVLQLARADRLPESFLQQWGQDALKWVQPDTSGLELAADLFASWTAYRRRHDAPTVEKPHRGKKAPL